jgi:serine/threonine protein kinase
VQTLASKEIGTITIVGTYGYIPLEQFGGKTTTASDLYSLGMTLIYLIAGVHPSELTQENGQVKFDKREISRSFYRWLEKMTQPHLDRRFNSAKSALIALNSEDVSSGDYFDLRPKHSKVKLRREGDKLEIITEEVSQPCIGIGCFLWLVMVVLMLFMSSFWGGWAVFASFILIPILSILLAFQDGYYQIISIEKNKTISLGQCRDLSKDIQWESSLPLYNINLLVYNPGYSFDHFLDSTGKEHKRGKVTIPPKLSIYTNNIEYKIGNAQLSQAEYWWLAQELSDFLDLKVEIIYPTPKVPPEASCGGC